MLEITIRMVLKQNNLKQKVSKKKFISLYYKFWIYIRSNSLRDNFKFLFFPTVLLS